MANCEKCKHAEWGFCEGVKGGYPRGYWELEECRLDREEFVDEAAECEEFEEYRDDFD